MMNIGMKEELSMGKKQKQRKSKKQRVGLSMLQEQRIKDVALTKTCSAAWVDAQFTSIYDTAPDGDLIVVRIHNPHVYPVPGMVVCVVCGVPTPPTAVDLARGVCLDCHCARSMSANNAYGPSSFGRVMDAIRSMRVRLCDMRLARKINKL